VIGFWSAFTWLVGMALIISLFSKYVVATFKVSKIVGNVVEHASSIIFAFKNKLVWFPRQSFC